MINIHVFVHNDLLLNTECITQLRARYHIPYITPLGIHRCIMRITSDGFRFDADNTKNGENPTETAGNTRGGGGGSLDAYDNNEFKMGGEGIQETLVR